MQLVFYDLEPKIDPKKRNGGKLIMTSFSYLSSNPKAKIAARYKQHKTVISTGNEEIGSISISKKIIIVEAAIFAIFLNISVSL